MTATEFITEVNTACEELLKNKLITDAKTSILDQLHNTEITIEERNKLYTAYLQQISLGALGYAIDIVKMMPEVEASQWKKLSAEAQVKKNFGYGNASIENGLGESTKDGIVDKQIEGFFKDMVYKAMKSCNENGAMLAQADVPTPEWMTDIIKLATEIMSDGKINIVKTAGETQVTYLQDATAPNGLDV